MAYLLNRWLTENRKKKERQREARLEMEVQERLQVREFGGQLCLCLDNVPVIASTAFNDTELKQARYMLKQYIKRTRWSIF
jgi:hypothetical protein